MANWIPRRDIASRNQIHDNALMARKTRGQFSISQALLEEMRTYVDAANADKSRTKALTATAVVEAGLIAFFESDDAKRVDLLHAAMGLRPMTKWGQELERVMGVDRTSKTDRPAAKRTGGGKAG